MNELQFLKFGDTLLSFLIEFRFKRWLDLNLLISNYENIEIGEDIILQRLKQADKKLLFEEFFVLSSPKQN